MQRRDTEKKLSMRPAMGVFYKPEPERLRFIKQIGVDDIILWGNTFRRRPESGTFGTWSEKEKVISYEELVDLQEYLEEHSIRLFAIENLPLHLYDHVIFGEDGRDAQIEAYCQSIANIGRAGIRHLGFNWIPDGVKRTTYSHPVRGGAFGTAYQHSQMADAPVLRKGPYHREDIWQAFQYFIERVLPVAEECDVKLSIHPNDPPVDSIAGFPHLFNSLKAYDQAFAIRPSDHLGFTFCLGNIEEMGEDPIETVRRYAATEKIHYVHFQSVSGNVPEFHEQFIDTGNYDPYPIVKAFKQAGFKGVMIPGHTPQIEGDTEWRSTESATHTPYHHPMGGYRARAYTIGYIRGMLNALKHDDA